MELSETFSVFCCMYSTNLSFQTFLLLFPGTILDSGGGAKLGSMSGAEMKIMA